MTVPSFLRRLAPAFLVRMWRSRIARRDSQRYAGKSPREIFSAIYASNAWGGNRGEFNSGSGSDTELTESYIQCVIDYCQHNAVESVVDLGCGDFRVGRRISAAVRSYTGVDVVPDLVANLEQNFGSDAVRFRCLDIIEDELPKADLVLIRQVLQHLSNDAIKIVLAKLSAFPSVIVTEHYPPEGRLAKPNSDKAIGPDTRLLVNSAVCLNEPPFSLKNYSEILRVPARTCIVAEGETLRTFVWRHSPHSGAGAGRMSGPG